LVLRAGEIDLNFLRIKKLVANNPARSKDVDETNDRRFALFKETLLG
jgi:hypothetical protein